jgi:hypothetical protein
VAEVLAPTKLALALNQHVTDLTLSGAEPQIEILTALDEDELTEALARARERRAKRTGMLDVGYADASSEAPGRAKRERVPSER